MRTFTTRDLRERTGELAEIAPILAAWRDWGYLLAPALLDAVLARAGEATPGGAGI